MTARQYVYGHLESLPERLAAASIFSGSGLSDVGYRSAGYRFVAQAELHEHRSALGKANFPSSQWVVGDITQRADEFVAYVGTSRLALLSITPPCQGLSSSNPTRGRRRTPDETRNRSRNMLLLEVVPIIERLRPRMFVCENVRQILTLTNDDDGRTVIDMLRERLPEYRVYHTIVNVADYGLPQARLRAVIVGISRDESSVALLDDARVLPWPHQTHSASGSVGTSPWVCVGDWLRSMRYGWLDAAHVDTASGEHPLHRIPIYDQDRYLQVASIPTNSGLSAYENDTCPSCGSSPVPVGRAYCSFCGRRMRNRPYVVARGGFRLIRGFHSSYRRMSPHQPAPPVMTSSGRVGSDFKIHPWEHRVLSVLECADLQTVPRAYDWSLAVEAKRFGLVREVVGEALPPYFTFLHGRLLRRLLEAHPGVISECASTSDASAKGVRRATVSRRRALTGRGAEAGKSRA